MRENKNRDRTGTLEAFENAYEDDLTDRKVSLPPKLLPLVPSC